MLIALLGAVNRWAGAAEGTDSLSLTPDAVVLLDQFGLRELTERPQPATVLEDEEASRSVRARTLYLRAQYFMIHSRWDLARPLLEEAVVIVPDNYAIQYLLAVLDSHTLKSDRALQRCDRLIEKQSDRIEAYELKGRILKARKRSSDAIALYKTVLKRWPRCESVFNDLLELALGEGDLDLTIEICKQRLEWEPRHVRTLSILGHAYELKARQAKDTDLYREAAKYYEAALEAEPRLTKLYPRLAEVYNEKLNQPSKALAALRRGLVAEPSDPEIRKAFEQQISSDPKDPKRLEAYRALAEEYPSSAELLELYALQLVAFGKYAEARDQLKRLLEIEPNNVKRLLALGRLELQDGDLKQARQHFDRAIRVASDDVETYETIGLLYLGARYYDEAVEFFEKALGRDPKRPAIYFGLAQAYRQTQQMDKAMEVLRRGLTALGPSKNRKLLLLDLSALQQQRKQYAEAVATLREAYEIDQTDMLTFFRLANLLLTIEDKAAFDPLVAKGRETFRTTQDEFQETLAVLLMEFHRYEEAIPELEALIKRYPDQWEYYSHLATTYQRLRQAANSERLYADARDGLSKKPLDFYRFAARYHGARYEHQKAYEALLNLLEQSPVVSLDKEAVAERTALYESLFFHLGRLKKHDEIGNLLERAERELGGLGAASTELKMLRAHGLSEMERYDEAVAFYRQMIADQPDEARLYYELGATLNEAKRIDEAEKSLRKCLEIPPKSPTTAEQRDLRATVLNHLGYMFAEEGIHLEEAERLLTEALEIQPRAGYIVDSMGWLQFKLGRTERALSLLKKAYDYSSEDPVLYDHLGDVYAQTGNREKALEYWRSALRLDPTLADIKTKVQNASK